ncbi:hypothetical protein ACWGB8_24025 [Kitasatospora sp. NPDC054939]
MVTDPSVDSGVWLREAAGGYLVTYWRSAGYGKPVLASIRR